MSAQKEVDPSEGHPLLDILRGQVDEIDEEIVALVARRTAFTLAIGQEKQRRGIPTMVSDRHNEVIGHYIDARPEDGPMTVQHAARLGEVVMGISRDAQDAERRQAEAGQSIKEADFAQIAQRIS